MPPRTMHSRAWYNSTVVASPLGHTLASCYFLRAHGRVFGIQPTLIDALKLMVLASLPDLDTFVGQHDGITSIWHRTLSHSFFFTLWIGCLIALIEALLDKGPLLRRAALYAAVISTHPLIDYFTVVPPYTGAMPLFWPLTGDFFASPVALFPSALTYASYIPCTESLTKTFIGEARVLLPALIAWEGYFAWKARAKAARPGTAPDLQSLQA
jgi:membrane-bound metal-dependent hydrolase YbcI (DUF457 family)